MPDLLQRVWGHLRAHDVAAVVIGASALASYGVSRSTHDIDLLVADRSVLAPGFWETLPEATVEVRQGDADDPLAGVVRCSQPGLRPIDLVVARQAWMRDIVLRAGASDEASPPTVARADWVCLKLFAGGLQDSSDVAQLRAIAGARLDEEVAARLADLPEELARRWARVASGDRA